jgi:hypothetical protein
MPNPPKKIVRKEAPYAITGIMPDRFQPAGCYNITKIQNYPPPVVATDGSGMLIWSEVPIAACRPLESSPDKPSPDHPTDE